MQDAPRPDRGTGPDCVLSIGAGPSQVPLIRAAHAAGFAVWALDRAASPAAAPWLAAHLPVGTHDPAAAIAAIRGHALAPRTCAVLQRTSGPALATAAAAAAALAVPGPAGAFCAAAVRKSVLRREAAALGLPVPAGCLVRNAAGLAERLPGGGPLLVKPDMPLRGKTAVLRLRPQDRGSARETEAILQAGRASANGLAEVQAWLPGHDVGLLLLLADGVPRLALCYDEIVAQQDDGHVHGLGLAAPAAGLGAAQLTALALPLARRLGMDRGFAFFSFRAGPGATAHLFEVNPGLCGDGIADRLLPALFPAFDPFAAEVAAWTGIAGPPLPGAPRPATLLGERLLAGDAAANEAAIAAAAALVGGSWTAAAA